MTLTFGSLFAGIGGFDLGLERAGLTPRWQVENDPYCQQILARHWPHVTRYGDIREVNFHELEPVDLICGGFPCQPVSKAGKRLAQRDARWLWPWFADAVRVLRPRYVLVENVPGLASAGMGDVLGDLAAVGYDAEWESIPAEALGAPHPRWRIFIVAYPNGGVASERGQRPSTEGARSGRRDHRGRGGGDVERQEPIRGAGEVAMLADTERTGLQGRSGGWGSGAWRPAIFPTGRNEGPRGQWIPEPDVGRVAHGVPHRVDRLRALGNAVVPQVAEYIARQILEADRQATTPRPS